MTVFLRTSWNIEPDKKNYPWYSITGANIDLSKKLLVGDIGQLLEESFTNIAELWWKIGKDLGKTKGGNFAHMPTAASYNSDFGQMLAWTKVTEILASRKGIFVAVCDDPWVFRQLAQIQGVEAGDVPRLWLKSLFLIVRGYLARIQLAWKTLIAVFLFKKHANDIEKQETFLLAYAHPSSQSRGHDAYFGDLTNNIPSIGRVIHTDGSLKFMHRLMGPGTASLHGWGSASHCFSLIFTLWSPDFSNSRSDYFWLIKRSVMIENGGAGIAANSWQIHCQNKFMLELKPKNILWPWENHPWEREITRYARDQKIKTIGYQHAVIGVQQFNPSPKSNHDGLHSIPSKIICSGEAYYNQLIQWGIPKKTLVIGGAFRFSKNNCGKYNPSGPVFVAASADTEITNLLMKAVIRAQGGGRKFLVKIHPLYPKKIAETKNIKITEKTIPEQEEISAVVYGTGASGLEGLLAGIPTFRIRSHEKVAINVLPKGVDAVPFSIDNLRTKLDKAVLPQPLLWETIYAPVDLEVWRRQLMTI